MADRRRTPAEKRPAWRVEDHESALDGTTLGLAIELVDAVTLDRPRGEPELEVTDAPVEPVRNRSGYHLLLDVPSRDYTVAIDGGEFHVDRTATVGPPSSGPPAVRVLLQPAPAYRVPTGLTRFRGSVETASEAPVADATVAVRPAGRSVEPEDRTTRTDRNGEFVTFLRSAEYDVETVRDANGEVVDRFVRLDGADPVLEVSHPDYDTATESVELSPGSLAQSTIIVQRSN